MPEHERVYTEEPDHGKAGRGVFWAWPGLAGERGQGLGGRVGVGGIRVWVA